MLTVPDSCFRVSETVRGEAYIVAYSNAATKNVDYF